MHIVWFGEFRGSFYIVTILYTIIILLLYECIQVPWIISLLIPIVYNFSFPELMLIISFTRKIIKKSGTGVPSLLFSANRINNNKLHVIIIYCHIVNMRFPKFSLIKFVRHDSARFAFQSVYELRETLQLHNIINHSILFWPPTHNIFNLQISCVHLWREFLKNKKIKLVLTPTNSRGKSLRRSVAFPARPVVVVSRATAKQYQFFSCLSSWPFLF